MDESQSDSHGSLIQRLGRYLRLRNGPREIQEIQEILDEGEERGLIGEEEGEMIDGIFDLKETVAREIMIPRTHIITLPVTAGLQDILSTIIQSGYSRIPVYKETVDQIVGILNVKDLMPYWLNNREDIDLASICREPIFVPETKRVNDLLAELRTMKSHMAVIVDEYGGTAGILTMEDIVEEIIGEIQDEHDVEEELFVPQKDGCMLVGARAPIGEFEEQFGVELPRGGYDTIGGYIIHCLGKVPDIGEELEHEGLVLRFFSGDPKRITRVLVCPCTATSSSDSVDQPTESL